MEKIIDRILHSIAKGEDGSLHVVSGESPSKGYMVGGASWTMTISTEFVDAYVIADFLSAHKAMLSWESKFVGWWTHKGRVYFDVSDNVTDEKVAITLGQSRNEIAIWDLDNNAEIQCA